MKTKFKTFLCGLIVAAYGTLNTILYYGAVNCFVRSLNASGIITILYFLGSLVCACMAVLMTFRAGKGN